MNQAADFEEENGVSSPNSTVSSLSGKRSEREPIGDENEAERTSCSHGSDDEDGNGGDLSRKKLRLTKEQSLLLEDTFKEHNTLNPVSRYFFLGVILMISQGHFGLFDLGLCSSLFFSGTCVVLMVKQGRFLFTLCIFLCSEAKAGVGKAAEPKTKTSGGLVSEQEGKVRKILHRVQGHCWESKGNQG